MTKPRLLIEDWLPAQAIGIECARENQFMAPFPPNRRLHVWWARRPLVASRAAVLGSLLPSTYDRTSFEKLLGFGLPSNELIKLREIMDSGTHLGGFGVKRAFSNPINEHELDLAHKIMIDLWGNLPIIIDPMAGGGSIPLEADRLGLETYANELNSVACSILEATLSYPVKFGSGLADKVKQWGKIWRRSCVQRLSSFFPKGKFIVLDGYIFTRTIPCPDTGFLTPLVSDWTLLKTNGGATIVADPIVDKVNGAWTVAIRELGNNPGQLRTTPRPTYNGGKAYSLFTENNKEIPSDYIKAIAQQGKMGSALYAVSTKVANKTVLRPPSHQDIQAILDAQTELELIRKKWEIEGILPTEKIPLGDKTKEPLNIGHYTWASLFSPRQLFTLGVLIEELRRVSPDILREEGDEKGNAIIHLLAFAIDKIVNFNCMFSRWTTRGTIAGKFDRHDYAFKTTYAEVAVCEEGSGLDWAIDDVAKAIQDLAQLPGVSSAKCVTISQGSATNLIELADKSITAVVVDPPYEANVQYSELADFFYVWLKRTQGKYKPEWFASYLCDHDQEAVVNITRNRKEGIVSASDAKLKAYDFYQKQMTGVFKEAERILRDDGVLTVMFTHKEQTAWAALFESLINSGFTITATWPVKTESENSLHQAKKNAAQSTVILVSRKREQRGSRGYFDANMQQQIREVAREAAARLKNEGLNPVDQLVGVFGPAMEVVSRYDAVFTDTGERVKIADAIQLAADAVAEWRIEQLAERGLEGIDPESRFILLCWDVLGAVEFRFNEAMLLGRSVGMDVNSLIDAGLVSKKGEKILLVPANDRRRDQPIRNDTPQLPFVQEVGRKRTKTNRKIHPNDDHFFSAIDACQALALKYGEAGEGLAGIGASKGMALQQGWGTNSPIARLMEALVQAAPEAVRYPGKGKKKTMADIFPEFRAWNAMLKPLFGISPIEWQQTPEMQPILTGLDDENEEMSEEGAEE